MKMKKQIAVLLSAAMVLTGASSALAQQRHTVERGDFLIKIAEKYGVNWRDIAKANQLGAPYTIYPGQTLALPGADGELPPAPQPAPSQTKESAVLSGLFAEDSAHSGNSISPAFDPSVTEYTLSVQSDIYGVNVVPQAEGMRSVTVNGTDATDGNGVVVELSQAAEDYGTDLSVTAEIVVTAQNGESNTYRLTIHRENLKDVYDAFEIKTFHDDATGMDMQYAIYVPDNYDASQQYPVVLFLHGAGQRAQDISMVLKRYEGATTWVKDGMDCIVVAPHCYDPDEKTGWTALWNDANEIVPDTAFTLTDYGKTAYNLLQDVKNTYSVDQGRIYCTGLSMGGFGTFALAIAHPDEFAAIVPVCGGADPAAVSALEGIPMWIFHAEADPTVDYKTFYAPTISALKAAGISCRTTVYDQDTFFYPMAHFSWTPAYADKQMKSWLFDQSKTGAVSDITKDVVLNGLHVEDASHTGIALSPDFSPDITKYTLSVQDDIYGVNVTPKASDAVAVTVNGQEVKSKESVVVELSQEIEDYGKDITADAEITVTGQSGISKTYTIHIQRENAADIYSLFTADTYTDTETGVKIPYNLYVPSDFKQGESLPLVLFLHGSGQRGQDVSMILKRYQGATIWAADAEQGKNRCIVLAPQCEGEENNWRNVDGYEDPNTSFEMSSRLKAVYKLLQDVKKEYGADENRIYCTGLSMGGGATWAMAAEHPDEFAALVPVCANAILSPEKASEIKDIPTWIFHAADDPTVPVSCSETMNQLLKDAGAKDLHFTKYEEGTFFFPSAHFSWAAAYANQDMRTWLFQQSK